MLAGAAQLRQVDAGAGAALEDAAFRLVPVQDGVDGVFDAEDEAGAALRQLLDADVEPDGGVEAEALVDEGALQLGAERLALLLAGEVAIVPAPAGDLVDHAVDELLDGALAEHAVLRLEGAAEVLGGDDVGGVLGPGGRELDVALLEDGGAVGRGDDRGARFPRELIVGVDVGAGEEALDGELGLAVADLGACLWRQCHGGSFRVLDRQSLFGISRSSLTPSACGGHPSPAGRERGRG